MIFPAIESTWEVYVKLKLKCLFSFYSIWFNCKSRVFKCKLSVISMSCTVEVKMHRDMACLEG